MERNILLCTMGRSPMIVPQAYLIEGTTFDEIHVFTTDNPYVPHSYEIMAGYFESEGVTFTVTTIEGISLPDTTQLNHEFEEALFQWYLEKSREQSPFVCLSGGTKTMPAIMQKAAQLFGAQEVFHLISSKDKGTDPATIEQVKTAIESEQLQIIRFGSEEGWQPFKFIKNKPDFSKVVPIRDGLFKKNKITSYPLTDELKNIRHRIKSFFTDHNTGALPFSGLLILSSSVHHWLQQPLCESDRNWLLSLPKTELHCHLGGFATQPPLLNEIRNAAEKPKELPPLKNIPLPPGWPLPPSNIDLRKYMQLGDNNGGYILSDPGCLKKQVRLLYQNLQQQNIKYAEIRCSPYNYTRYQSATEVLEEIISTFQHLMDESDDLSRCHVNLIIIVSRKDEGDLSSISKHLALAITATLSRKRNLGECRVVGVDLAGYETKSTRASYFRHDFIGVHRCGLAVTAHAGENDDVEGVWQAVYELNARRIGHALHLFQSEDLMRVFADRQIAIEMCPYANYQIKGFAPMAGKEKDKYPLLKYLRAGIPISVNTDNIGISAANLTDNFLLLAKMLPEITRIDVLQLIKNGIITAFQQENEKQIFLSSFERRIIQVCQKVSM